MCMCICVDIGVYIFVFICAYDYISIYTACVLYMFMLYTIYTLILLYTHTSFYIFIHSPIPSTTPSYRHMFHFDIDQPMVLYTASDDGKIHRVDMRVAHPSIHTHNTLNPVILQLILTPRVVR